MQQCCVWLQEKEEDEKGRLEEEHLPVLGWEQVSTKPADWRGCLQVFLKELDVDAQL